MIRLASLFAVMFSVSVFAADSLKLADSASTKIKKTPKGSPIPAIEQPTYKSSYNVVIPAPGLDPATFTASTTVGVTIADGSGSSSDYTLTGEGGKVYTFGDDPKYTPGAKSVKITQLSQPGINVKQNVFRTIQVKFGKDAITISVKESYLSIFAQMYLNYGTLGVVQYPEGKGTASRTMTMTATVGTLTKTYSGVNYDVSYSNKKVDVSGTTYWTGNAKGSASAQ
jgi:hypothetical protein